MLSLILSRTPFREHDEQVHVFTKDKGKLELVTKGTKKITSKNAAQIEPCSLVQIDVTQGKALAYLLRAVPVNRHQQIRARLDASLAAGYVVSVLDKLLQPAQPEPVLFALILDWLTWLEKGGQVTLPILDAVMLAILGELGVAPVLDQCVVSGETYQEMMHQSLSSKRANPGLYLAGGGLICAAERIKKQRVGERILECGLIEISNLQLLQKANWRNIATSNMSAAEVQALHRLVYEYLLYHTERKVSDWGSIVSLST